MPNLLIYIFSNTSLVLHVICIIGLDSLFLEDNKLNPPIYRQPQHSWGECSLTILLNNFCRSPSTSMLFPSLNLSPTLLARGTNRLGFEYHNPKIVSKVNYSLDFITVQHR